MDVLCLRMCDEKGWDDVRWVFISGFEGERRDGWMRGCLEERETERERERLRMERWERWKGVRELHMYLDGEREREPRVPRWHVEWGRMDVGGEERARRERGGEMRWRRREREREREGSKFG